MGSGSGGGSGSQAAVLPRSLEEQASSIASMPHVPVLPLDEGNAAENGAACGSSSSRVCDKPGLVYGQGGAQQQQQQQWERDNGSQRTGKRNSTRISANGSSVVLTRNKSQGNAKNRRGTAGATAAAVAAAAVARPKLVPAISAMIADSSSSSSSIGAGAEGVSSGSVGEGLGACSGDGPGSWLWRQAPPAGTAMNDLAQLCIAAKPST
jgi:hypothetical protein